MEDLREEGFAKGKAKGFADGKAESAAEFQKFVALLRDGKSIEEAEQILGLNAN